MRELDGSEASGQFFRTAIALAALGGEPVRIRGIRGARSDPGLKAQHLAALETLAAVCDAEVSGAELGAETVEFDPGRIEGGSYAVEIGTAGSVTLVFDTLLPLATELDADLSVTATGGTDVEWAPPIDYHRRVKLPLLRRFGLDAAVEVDRRGFFPAGGGRATLRLSPSTLDPIRLEERGDARRVRIYSTEAEALADADVAYRQAGGAIERLDDEYEVGERIERTVESDCPGSAIVLRVDCGGSLAGFSALGERGKPAERVGEEAADAANRFLDHDAPIDGHAADQLLPFLAMAGGRLRIPAVTDHVETGRSLLASFGREVRLESGETLVADGS